MKFEEINKIIDEYEESGKGNPLVKSTADTMRMLVQRAFDAGVNSGLETVTKIQEQMFNK